MNLSEVGWSDELCTLMEANLQFISIQESPAGEQARRFWRLYKKADWDDPELMRLGAPLMYALFHFSQTMNNDGEDDESRLLRCTDNAMAIFAA